MNLRAMARGATMLFLATFMSIFYANWVSEVNRLSCMMDWGCLVGYERSLLMAATFVAGCLAGVFSGHVIWWRPRKAGGHVQWRR